MKSLSVEVGRLCLEQDLPWKKVHHFKSSSASKKTLWLEKGGSQMVQGQKSKGEEKRFHGCRCVLSSGQCMHCELECYLRGGLFLYSTCQASLHLWCPTISVAEKHDMPC